jgi:hypothetical protein
MVVTVGWHKVVIVISHKIVCLKIVSLALPKINSSTDKEQKLP